ncbi:MAG: cytochrome C [Deltaproteobacteria bacterium]|nr:MAG: cytochrome C [Deltaproteobacteria bacterium]
MEKGRSGLQRAVGFVTITILSIFIMGLGVRKVPQSSDDAAKVRADIITIDYLKTFGELERPPVLFLHDKHTAVLEKKNKGCQTCHLSENNQLVPKFKRLKDTDKTEVMDIFHTQCIACHRQTAANKEKSGPVSCGDCHKDEITISSSRQPMGMDKSLHFRHSKAHKEKCETCHHEYNEQTQKLFYAKGKEGTCRYCHGKTTVEKKISMRLAAHLSCIDCHRKTLGKNQIAGPINCSGCHDINAQKMIEVVDDVPRLKRNQPDVVFVKKIRSKDKNSTTKTEARMNAVAFSHFAHEGYNHTCRVCHHADLNACASCHTLQGSKDGKQVKLEQAMHQLQSEQSCLGCHQINQQEKQCAGCHASLEQRRKREEATCRNCNASPLPENTSAALEIDDKTQAARLLASRIAVTATYNKEDIPEKVVIDGLLNKYKAVDLPHRKIVLTLVRNIKDNKLANYFHSDLGTICQGCHHNSPLSKKPPKCASCHGRPFVADHPLRPGLMAAYHSQCMECHKEMGIEKPVATDCNGCHKEK